MRRDSKISGGVVERDVETLSQVRDAGFLGTRDARAEDKVDGARY